MFIGVTERQGKLTVKLGIRFFEKENIYNLSIVTEVAPFETFYKAEDYHKDYFERNEDQPYCQFIVAPKVAKFKKIFKEKLEN